MSQSSFYQTYNFVICLFLLGIFASFGYIVGKDQRDTHLHQQQFPKNHQQQPDMENEET